MVEEEKERQQKELEQQRGKRGAEDMTVYHMHDMIGMS